MKWLALDIGGANLKMADGLGFAESRSFAVWQQPELLRQELRLLIAEGGGDVDHLAITMTAELADCFETKADGVKYILSAVEGAADGRHTRVYLVNGKLVTQQVALRSPHLVAAANWHALATFVGRFAPEGAAILLDIGSTTTDIIPLQNGKSVAQGQTDTERLMHGELIYTGVVRTPLNAVAREVPYRGGTCPLAAELFASMLDVYLTLSVLPENPRIFNTADRRPATKAAARERLARAICADRDSFSEQDALVVAASLAKAQFETIAGAMRKMIASLTEPPRKIIVSGQGEFLARQVCQQIAGAVEIVSLTEKLGPMVSQCAPAHALAVLAREAAGIRP